MVLYVIVFVANGVPPEEALYQFTCNPALTETLNAGIVSPLQVTTLLPVGALGIVGHEFGQSFPPIEIVIVWFNSTEQSSTPTLSANTLYVVLVVIFETVNVIEPSFPFLELPTFIFVAAFLN